MIHDCPICNKRIPKPRLQARSHILSAHETQKAYSTVTRWLKSIGVKTFKRHQK